MSYFLGTLLGLTIATSPVILTYFLALIRFKVQYKKDQMMFERIRNNSNNFSQKNVISLVWELQDRERNMQDIYKDLD